MADDRPRLDVNAQGMVRHLVDWPVEMECRAGIWIVRDNWKSIRQHWDLKGLKYSPYGTTRTIDGRFEFAEGAVQLHQEVGPDRLSYELTPTASMDVTGVYWFMELPVSAFAGGQVSVGGKLLALPEQKGNKWIGSANANSFEVRSKSGTRRLSVRFPEALEVRVQDAREFGEARYQIFVPVTEQALVANAKHQFSVTVEPAFSKDSADATVMLDAKSIRGEFDGFGGNFVYAIDDPATQIALDSFKLTWARVGMELAKWEPENDNGDPNSTHFEKLTAADQPGSALRKRFEMDRKLFALSGGRMIASVWAPPKWFLPEGKTQGPIPREKWDELAECITSYLIHLKNRYGVEPALFSFNESDIGIDVLLNAEETRDIINLLGARFETAGLRTKILLGDSADLKKGLVQIEPTLNDREAMKHVAALAYHTWNDQSAHWKAWADIAQKHGLMLMTTEMGDDPASWQDGSYNSPINTLHLAEKYLRQLRDARTQVLLEWEWTGDYSVTATGADGKRELSNRGRFLRQLTQTTPTQANVIEAKCDADSITATAVMADDGKSAAIHLLNRGGDRTIRIAGVPAPLSLGTLFVIDPLTGEKTPQHVEVKGGACEFRVPSGAIMTLAFPQVQ